MYKSDSDQKRKRNFPPAFLSVRKHDQNPCESLVLHQDLFFLVPILLNPLQERIPLKHQNFFFVSLLTFHFQHLNLLRSFCHQPEVKSDLSEVQLSCSLSMDNVYSTKPLGQHQTSLHHLKNSRLPLARSISRDQLATAPYF